MIAARLYHRDSSVCVDGWSCGEQEHTSVPPRCDAAIDRQTDCELPKGHPGPHLRLTAHPGPHLRLTGHPGAQPAC
jgi:hypothetical protein